MSNGVMQFTLGLEASNFLRNLNVASGGVLGLASMGQVVQSTFRNVWAQIEKGGALQDLSNRTGQTVGQLFALQHAFQQAGLGAQELSPMVLRMQRSLSGINEEGGKTDDLFKALGLDMDKLRAMDSAKAIEAIATSLGKLNQADAAKIANTLFGREGAGAILQIARDARGFRDALAEAAGSAAVFQRSAKAFDQLGDSVNTAKSQISGLYAILGEQMTPALQQVMDQVNKELTIAFNAVDLGKFGEYFELTLKAGVQSAVEMLTSELKGSGLFAEGGKPRETAKGVGAGLAGLGMEALNVSGVSPENLLPGGSAVRNMLGLPSVSRMLGDKAFDVGYSQFEKTGMNDGPLMGSIDPIKAGLEGRPNQYQEALAKLREEMLKVVRPSGGGNINIPSPVTQAIQQVAAPVVVGGGGGVRNPDMTSLERIGFVLNGRAGGGENKHAERTAANTTKMNEHLVKLAEYMRDLQMKNQ